MTVSLGTMMGGMRPGPEAPGGFAARGCTPSLCQSGRLQYTSHLGKLRLLRQRTSRQAVGIGEERLKKTHPPGCLCVPRAQAGGVAHDAEAGGDAHYVGAGGRSADRPSAAPCWEPSAEDSAVALYFRAYASFERGNYQEAIRDLDAADALWPNALFIVRKRGAAKLRLGLLGEARTDLDRAAALGPRDGSVALLRAELNVLTGSFGEALDDLDHAVGLLPKDPDPFVHRADLKRQLGRLEEALDDLDRANALRPKDGLTLALRGDRQAGPWHAH
eukprot:jgi/Botrbrau1/17880/Bobra.0717s0003.1